MKRAQLFLTSSIGSVASHIRCQLPKRRRLKVAFIVTACELESDDRSWIDRDRAALIEAGFDVDDYTITGKSVDAIYNHLKAFDCVCIEGGNTFYLLKQVQLTGCAPVFHELINAGVVYIGSSAGSVLAGPNVYPLRHTDPLKEERQLKRYEGLGLVDFVVFPHWGQESTRDLYLSKRLPFNYNEDHKLVLLTDYQYVHVHKGRYAIVDVRSK